MSTSLTARFEDLVKKGRRTGTGRWRFSRLHWVIIGFTVLALSYLILTLASSQDQKQVNPAYLDMTDAESFYQHMTHPDQESALKFELRPASHGPGMGVDSRDVNPTMPFGIKKALVVASYEGQDLSWLEELEKVSPGWDVYRYFSNEEGAADSGLGREATAFLQFIVDHYHKFPAVAIFNHGHDRSWHQPMRLLDKITTLNHTALEEEHYITLRCPDSPGCTEDTKYYFDNPHEGDMRWGYRLKPFWDDIIRPSLGPMPRIIARKCCAQFALDPVGVHHRPLIFYERLLEPLVTKNMSQLSKVWDDTVPRERIATMYEMVWNQIFGKPADFCPSEDLCNNVHFQGKIHCDREIEGFMQSEGWEDIKCVNELMVNKG